MNFREQMKIGDTLLFHLAKNDLAGWNNQY